MLLCCDANSTVSLTDNALPDATNGISRQTSLTGKKIVSDGSRSNSPVLRDMSDHDLGVDKAQREVFHLVQT